LYKEEIQKFMPEGYKAKNIITSSPINSTIQQLKPENTKGSRLNVNFSSA